MKARFVFWVSQAHEFKKKVFLSVDSQLIAGVTPSKNFRLHHVFPNLRIGIIEWNCITRGNKRN